MIEVYIHMVKSRKKRTEIIVANLQYWSPLGERCTLEEYTGLQSYVYCVLTDTCFTIFSVFAKLTS